jgi:hypothetical protein
MQAIPQYFWLVKNASLMRVTIRPVADVPMIAVCFAISKPVA